MDEQDKSSTDGEPRKVDVAAAARDIRTEGGDFVGRDHIVVSGNVIVLTSPPEALLQQLTWMINFKTEGSPGNLASGIGLPAQEDRNALQRSIDQVLALFESAALDGISARDVSAGAVQISQVELLLKKAILLRADAEERLLDQLALKRGDSGISGEDESERSLMDIDFAEAPTQSMLESAYALLKKANDIDPTNTEVLLQMAELLVDLTPDDPRDEERILNRVLKLLRDPKNDREKFRFAQATYLLATTRDQVDRQRVRQARSLFKSLDRIDWLKQCDQLLAGIAAEGGPVENKHSADLSGSALDGVFNPVGRWHIQVMDAAGSIMFLAIQTNGTFQSIQQVDGLGLNVQRVGQWAYNPINHALELQGMIDGVQPFMLGIFIQGRQEKEYYGLGTDGYGYLLSRA